MSDLLHRVPITTVGGFLGAGKTTLINHLLEHANGQRIVVFVNDFGAINIDTDLIETVKADRISLKNGCVCCTLNDDLVTGIAGFARAETPPDAIVVEASGISNPRALDASLSTFEGAGLTRLDLRIYVLDVALFGTLDYADSELILDHAAASDVILLNKTDLAAKANRRALLDDLKEAAPFSVTIETRRCAIDPLLLTGLSSRDRSSTPIGERDLPASQTHKYETWSFETESRFHREKFETLLRELPQYCIRAKGFVGFADTPSAAHLFNLVGYCVDLEACTFPPNETNSRLVFIGPDDKFDVSRVKDLVMDAICDLQAD